MKKKIIVLTLCAMLFALSSSAHAQPTGKVARIGFLDESTASGMATLVEEFRQEMRKLGWIEGKNIAIEYKLASKSLSACKSLRRTWFVLRLI
jgi:putative ABC transport system substrate-binding protein